LALSLCDCIGLAVIFMFWPLLLPSNFRFVLNYYRALKLYDGQEPNPPLALAASAAREKQNWWKRNRLPGPKGWWLAALIHKLSLVAIFITYTLFCLTLAAHAGEHPSILPAVLTKRLPDLFIFSLFFNMSVSDHRLHPVLLQALTLLCSASTFLATAHEGRAC
jgi:hypothetical protein